MTILPKIRNGISGMMGVVGGAGAIALATYGFVSAGVVIGVGGVFYFLQSADYLSQTGTAIKIQKEIDRFQENNTIYSQHLAQHKQQVDRLEEEVTNARVEFERYQGEIDKLTTFSGTLENENAALRETEKNLRKTKNDLQKQVQTLSTAVKDSQETIVHLNAEITRLQEIHNVLNQELHTARVLSQEQAQHLAAMKDHEIELTNQIAFLEEQAKNLNKLQKKSTKMIQMLALYGDDCKSLGINLKDVSQDLHKTDESLGLKTEEMAQQIKAMSIITKELKRYMKS